MFWVEILPAALFLGALLFIPESPRYLAAKGRKEQALGVLTRDVFGPAAKGKAQIIKLFLRCRKQEITLIFGRVYRAQ